MNVLIIEAKSFGLEDIKDLFIEKNYNITKYYNDDLSVHRNEKIESELSTIISDNNIDFVFSFNYYPIISVVLKDTDVKYISYVYDCPHIALYTYTIIHPCNYIFIFDYAMYAELKNGGINTVYYLPLSINEKRIKKMIPSIDDMSSTKSFSHDISFVGSLYNEDHTLYNRLINKLENDKYTIGYLDSLIEVQSNIYGYFILEKMITDELLDKLMKAYPYVPENDSIATSKYTYAHYFFARKCTELERKKLLKKVSENYKLSLFTKNNTPDLPKANNKGPIDYYNEMPHIFNKSKINLNITLKSITTGIPLRAIDIMGCGGFLLTNYQEDMNRHFTPGVDYDFFSSSDDLISKIDYYLEHDDIRNEIAYNGYKKVSNEFTFEKNLNYMLETANIK